MVAATIVVSTALLSACSSSNISTPIATPAIPTSIVIGSKSIRKEPIGVGGPIPGVTLPEISATAAQSPAPIATSIATSTATSLVTSIATSVAKQAPLPSQPHATGPLTPPPPLVTVKPTGVELTLLTYDSFALSKGLLEGFTAATGIQVRVRRSGDSGQMVDESIASRQSPLGDVMWGISLTNLQTAKDGAILYPYMSRTRNDLFSGFTSLAPNNDATPIDYGDVCVNYDRAALAAEKLVAPTSFEDFVKPSFRGKLVVENPASSAPGLAFLYATIAHFGPDGWQKYWADLRANDVKVIDTWTVAYNTMFRGGPGKGTFPLVVAYGTSPVAALNSNVDPKLTTAPTGVVEATCFRDVEFAAVIIGTRHPNEAGQLLEFLSSVPVQEDVPLSMFLYPANSKARIPNSFTEFTDKPAAPLGLDAKQVAANKDLWLKQWASLMQ